jgi:hypothetical protein
MSAFNPFSARIFAASAIFHPIFTHPDQPSANPPQDHG